MTEPSREQALVRYLAATKAVSAYGLVEKFEADDDFATEPMSLCVWIKNAPVVNAFDVHVQTVPAGRLLTDAVRWEGGQTYGLNFTKSSLVVPARFEVLPLASMRSGALEALSMGGQGSSMATQQPSIIDEESVEEIIWRVRTTLPLPYRVRLASRLGELQKAVQEEELDCRGISVGSLQHFIEFLEAYPALRYPAVSVTPDRNIYGSWKSGSERVFSIHFLPDGEVRFVIFRPNDKHPGQAIRLSGTATVDVVISIAAPHGVLDWVSE